MGEIVLVTGASGCLGHHVVKMLISLDDNVQEIRCLDLREQQNLMKKMIQEEKGKFMQKMKANNRQNTEKRIITIKGDIRDVNVVEKIIKNVDCVIHCAAAIDLWSNNDEKNVEELESINVCGTENLLKACIRYGVHKFIHVSSFEVYSGIETIYYATENTLPIPKWYLFGPSAWTKKEAENKVKQYSNNKLVSRESVEKHQQQTKENSTNELSERKDSLNAIIVRFPTIYGEFDRHYVSKILEITKFFGGRLLRMNNIWIRQQPIYVGNAAWSLLKAKQRMDVDQSISGEEFHITDETAIGDPFDFVEPYLQSRGMKVTKKSYPFLPIWIFLLMFFALRKFLKSLDLFGLFTYKKTRLQEAMEKDAQIMENNESSSIKSSKEIRKRWYDYITPQTLSYMCNSNFLNRTKASLRLDYEPLIDPEESKKRSLDWYKNHLQL